MIKEIPLTLMVLPPLLSQERFAELVEKKLKPSGPGSLLMPSLQSKLAAHE